MRRSFPKLQKIKPYLTPLEQRLALDGLEKSLGDGVHLKPLYHTSIRTVIGKVHEVGPVKITEKLAEALAGDWS